MIPEQFMQYVQKLAEEFARITGFPPSTVINGNYDTLSDAERTVTCALLMELKDVITPNTKQEVTK